MELRKRGKAEQQETNLSVKNPTNNAIFRKLIVPLIFGEKEKVCRLWLAHSDYRIVLLIHARGMPCLEVIRL